MALHRVLVGGRPMGLTRHAVERYVERVKPALTFAAALEELDRLLRLCEVQSERPAWASTCRQDEAWVVVSDGIAFPVANGDLVSCLTRSETGAELRMVKTEERRSYVERKGQRGFRKKYGKVARDERRRARQAREALGDA